MHLYLSSYGFGSDPGRLAGLKRAGNSAVVIANALDYSDDIARRNAGTAREIDGLGRLGFHACELDLRLFFGKPGALIERLANVGLIWAVGGNSFLLRRALKQSGLGDHLLGRRGDDTLIYGGYSAGAIVVTPTLAGIEFADQPEAVAPGYDPEIVWDGLGLVPYSIAPHYDSDHPESRLIGRTVQHFIDNKMWFKALRDGEVIVTKA